MNSENFFEILQNEKLEQFDYSSLLTFFYCLIGHDQIGFLNTEDMISQVNIYVMDVAWILCDVFVEVKILCYCKASLRICCVSLLECKGPLMLKLS